MAVAVPTGAANCVFAPDRKQPIDAGGDNAREGRRGSCCLTGTSGRRAQLCGLLKCTDMMRSSASTAGISRILAALKRCISEASKRSSAMSAQATGTGVFNHLHAPFNNPAIRRVVLEAFSQEDCMAAAAGDPKLWRAGVGVFPPDTPMANDAGLEAITKPRDLAASRKALQAAGYKGERVVLMAPSDNPNLMAIGEVANDVLRKLGMDVDYVVTDWGTLVQRRANKGAPSAGGWSMFNTTWNGMDLANPGVSQMLRASGTQTYFGWPDIPELEKLRLAWIDSPDEAERKKLARDIQAVALREAVYIPTGQFFNHTAYSKRLVDIPEGISAFWGTRFA